MPPPRSTSFSGEDRPGAPLAEDFASNTVIVIRPTLSRKTVSFAITWSSFRPMTKTMPSRAARVKQVEAVLSTVLENGRVVAADGSSHEIVPISIPRMEGDALRRWVEREDAVHTIEVGLAYGVSALFICAGLLA